MPIVFQPPEPLGLGIVAGYGALQQREKDREFALKAARARQEAAESRQRLQLAAMQAEQQAYEFEAQRVPSEKDYFLAELQSQKMQEQAQLSNWLNEQDLTFKDEMRMKTLKSKISDVLADDSLDEANKRDLVLQLKTGIDPLEQRYKAQQARVLEQQEKLQAQQIKKAEEYNAEVQKFRAMTIEERVGIITDPETGEQIRMLQTAPDRWEPIPFRRTQEEKPIDLVGLYRKAEQSVSARMKGQRDEFNKPKPIDLDEYQKAVTEEYDHLRSLAEEARSARSGRTQFLQALPPGMAGPPRPMGPGMGVPGRPGGMPMPDPPGGVPDGRGGMVLPPPPAEEAPPLALPPRPFDAGKPETLTAEQRDAVNNFVKMRQKVMETIPDREDRQRIWGYINGAQELLEAWGDVSRMPPEVRQQYFEFKRLIQEESARESKTREQKKEAEMTSAPSPRRNFWNPFLR